MENLLWMKAISVGPKDSYGIRSKITKTTRKSLLGQRRGSRNNQGFRVLMNSDFEITGVEYQMIIYQMFKEITWYLTEMRKQ